MLKHFGGTTAVAAIGSLLVPLPAFAHGEQLMAYPLSAFVAIILGAWIIIKAVKSLWRRALTFGVLIACIGAIWQYLHPEPASLYEHFVWWTLLFTAIPLLVGTLTAVLLRNARNQGERRIHAPFQDWR